MRTLTGAINEALNGTINEANSNPIADIKFENATLQDLINFLNQAGLKTKELQKVAGNKQPDAIKLEDLDGDSKLKKALDKMSNQKIEEESITDWLSDVAWANADLYDAWQDWKYVYF